MKKLFLEEPFKQFNKRRSQKVMRKKRTKKKRLSCRVPNIFKEKYRRTAPDVFSLIENPNKTIAYFYQIEKTAYINHYLFIDIRKITVITPETILYLLSFLERINNKKGVSIHGNAPADKKCKQIFLHSGFYDYVQSQYKTPTNIDIITVKSDHLVDGKLAKSIIDFARRKLSLPLSSVTQAFYTTILECMGNTKEHAYNNNFARYGKWWLIAYYDTDRNCIDFSILDNGKGIPETVRKKFYENILPPKDIDIIKSVLRGDFRTSTKLHYRGKGLPKINTFMQDKLIQNLIILSNEGFYNADNGSGIVLDSKFKGTLICWSFIKGADNGN